MKKKLLIAVTGVLAGIVLTAQDIHWSQPGACLVTQNPAFAGAQEQYGFGLNYRNQWDAVGVPYSSVQVAGDVRLQRERSTGAVFGTGGFFSNDVAGGGRYRTTTGGGAASCLVKTNEQVRVGAGLGVSVVQSALQMNRLSWGTQFNGLNYDPSLSSGEAQGAVSKWYADISAGLSMIYRDDAATLSSNNSTMFIAGYSISHLNRPEISLSGGSDRLNMKHTLFVTGIIGTKNKNLALKPVAFYYRQGKLNEITAGLLLRFVTGEGSQITGYKKGSSFSVGALYRVNDAIVPVVQFEKEGFTFGLSYDINVSSLSPSSRLRGGMELSISFMPSGFLYKGKNEPKEK